MPSARERELERLLMEERNRTIAAQQEVAFVKEGLAYYEREIEAMKARAAKPDVFVVLTVHASQVEFLTEMLENRRMELVAELGAERADATDEVRFIHDLLDHVSRQAPPQGF